MHYNLTPLRKLFKKYDRSEIVLKLEDMLQGGHQFIEEYYLAGELITSKIEAHIKPYDTIIWKLTIQRENKVDQALNCSRNRMKERLSRQPPAWIYSSVFFNELNHLL